MDDLKLANLKNIIDQLKVIYDKHEELQKRTGDKFNIFSILNMERMEVETHSAFLYELLNPKGSHYQGTLYLKLFIENVLQIEDFDYENVIVDRERDIKDFERIDLAIENDTKLIIIEIKIDASDEKERLKKCSDYAKNTGKEYAIYYLTLFETRASEHNTGAEENMEFTPISFASHILNWLEACIRAGSTPFLTSIRETLRQYSAIVKKITNQVDGGLAMDIKELLMKDNNLEILDEAYKVVPYIKAEVEYDFWYNLYKKCSRKAEELGYKFIEDGRFPVDKKASIDDIVEVRKSKNMQYYFDYSIGTYDKYDVRLVIGNSVSDTGIYLSLVLTNTAGNYISYIDYDEEILDEIVSLGFDKSGIAIKYKYVNYDLNFQDKYVYKLFNKEYMDKSVECIGNEILDVFEAVNKSKKLRKLLDK